MALVSTTLNPMSMRLRRTSSVGWNTSIALTSNSKIAEREPRVSETLFGVRAVIEVVEDGERCSLRLSRIIQELGTLSDVSVALRRRFADSAKNVFNPKVFAARVEV